MPHTYTKRQARAQACGDRLTAALDYAARGWRVFPVHGVRDGRCTCSKRECAHPGKHPITRHGFHDATTDPSTIIAWWAKYPEANIAIATGGVSGLVALDVDPRHDGDRLLDQLEREHEIFPTTLTVQTGGGGRHFLFTIPTGVHVRSTKLAGDGVELKADGGYIIAVPSTHISGRLYTWSNDAEPAKMPAWPLALRSRNPGRTLAQHAREDAISSTERDTPLPPWLPNTISVGARHQTLTRLAGWLRRYGADATEIANALRDLSTQRCPLPLPEAEVWKIARSVARYPAGRPGDHKHAECQRIAAAIGHTTWPGRSGATDRVLLEAHLAIRHGSRRSTYHASVRDLAERAGLNKETVTKGNRRLVAGGWLVPTSPTRPGAADASEWRLRTPAATNRTLPVRRTGGSLSVRFATAADAFRWGGLGKNAAPVLRAVDAGATRPPQIAVAAGVADRTVRNVLTRCAAYGLVVRDDCGGWRLGDVSRQALDRVARARGTAGKGIEQAVQHVHERAVYRLALELRQRGEAPTLREARRLAATVLARMAAPIRRHVATVGELAGGPELAPTAPDGAREALQVARDMRGAVAHALGIEAGEELGFDEAVELAKRLPLEAASLVGGDPVAAIRAVAASRGLQDRAWRVLEEGGRELRRRPA